MNQQGVSVERAARIEAVRAVQTSRDLGEFRVAPGTMINGRYCRRGFRCGSPLFQSQTMYAWAVDNCITRVYRKLLWLLLFRIKKAQLFIRIFRGDFP